MRVSSNSQLYNGARVCHVHQKSINNNQLVLREQNQEESIENISQSLVQYSVYEGNIENNVFINTKRCSSKTKSGCRCTKKTSNESGVCHVHQKLMKKDEIKEVSDKILFMIKSPSINYKIDRQKDNCFVCLEDCEKR
jgi:hypothetical protein